MFVLEAVYTDGQDFLVERYYVDDDKFGSPHAFEIDGRRYVVVAWTGRNEPGRNTWQPWTTPPSGYTLVTNRQQAQYNGSTPSRLSFFNEMTGTAVEFDVHKLEDFLGRSNA